MFPTPPSILVIVAASVIMGTAVPTSANSLGSDNEFECVHAPQVWSFTLINDNTVQLFNKELYTMHANLVGAVPYGTAGLIVYDEVELKIHRFDHQGNRVWSAGQEGDGPEDHRQPAEPFVLPDGRVALVSYSPQSKIVYHGDDGAFLGSLDLPGFFQYHRLAFAGGNTYALAHKQSGVISTGLTIEVYLIAIDQDGLPRSERLINTATWKTWRPGEVVEEVDFWIVPRIGAVDRGRVFLQEDVFQPSIGIYNRELEPVIRIDADWEPLPRPQHEADAVVERSQGATVPAPTMKALRHVLLVGDEIWLQKPRNDGRFVFRVHDTAGRFQADRELCLDLPPHAVLNCHDNRLLAFTVDEDQEGRLVTQTFTLYDLSQQAE